MERKRATSSGSETEDGRGKAAANVLVAAERRRLVSAFESSLRPEYNVWTATSGRQALDIIDNEVDVIIVSAETTDISGEKVVSKTEGRGIDYKAASVGYGSRRELFDGYVPTPVTYDKIVGTVGELVEEKRDPFEGFSAENPIAEDYEEWGRERSDILGKEVIPSGSDGFGGPSVR